MEKTTWTSHEIAKITKKPHHRVLEKIRYWREKNYLFEKHIIEKEKIINGRRTPCFDCDKQAVVFLVLRFEGVTGEMWKNLGVSPSEY